MAFLSSYRKKFSIQKPHTSDVIWFEARLIVHIPDSFFERKMADNIICVIKSPTNMLRLPASPCPFQLQI